ncbi:MAG: CcdB family protein, partial [Exilibacterium sp.]
MPLGTLNSVKNESMKGLTPEIEYDGEILLLLTPQIASIPAKALKHPIGSLRTVHEITSGFRFRGARLVSLRKRRHSGPTSSFRSGARR